MDFNFQDGSQQANGLYTADNGLQLYSSLDSASVLNTQDQGYLDSFFSNPDDTVPLPVMPGAPYSMDPNKQEVSSDRSGSAYRLNPQPDTINPAVTYGGPPTSMYSYVTQGNGASPTLGTHGHVYPHANTSAELWNSHTINHVSTDSAAANSLVNLAKNNPSQMQSAGFANAAQQADHMPPWGGFANPNVFGDQAMSHVNFPTSPYVFQAPMTPHVPRANLVPTHLTRHHSLSYATDLAEASAADLHHPQQYATNASAARTRHMSIDANLVHTGPFQPNQSPQQQQQQSTAPSPTSNFRLPERPPVPVRFGSDGNFGVQGYRNPSDRPIKHDKSGNLLGAYPGSLPLVGLANQPMRPPTIATSAYPGLGYTARDPHVSQSSPTGLAGLPVTSPASAKTNKSSWGAMRPVTHADEDSHKNGQQSSRKRRKPEGGDDDEYLPESSTARRGTKPFKQEISEDDDEADHRAPSTSKRRKSTTADATGSPPAAAAAAAAADDDEDDDDDEEGHDGPPGGKKGRGSKRTRDNLTDAQKRHNHIMSEKKRRDVINNGYADLNQLVPSLAQGKSGMSRSESLVEVVAHMQSVLAAMAEVEAILALEEKKKKKQQQHSNSFNGGGPSGAASGQYF